MRPFVRCAVAAALIFSAAADAAGAQTVSCTLTASDGVPIAYEHYRNGHEAVIIVCPGFYNSKQSRWMRKTVEMLSGRYDVIIIDLRGHGESGGAFTWGAKEDMDIDAAVDYAKEEGYRRIGILAFSLGAAAAVNAASRRDDIRSMALISCPASSRMIDFHFWEPGMFSDLFDNIECGWEGKGARTTHLFVPKVKPIDSIRGVRNTAVLFIHGDHDWVIKDRHSRRLYDAAAEPKRLEIIRGGLHAERLIQLHPEEMERLILGWFSETLGPER